MLYDEERIKNLIPQFIKSHRSEISFFKKGKKINVSLFSGIHVINVTKGDYGDGFNFEAVITIDTVQIEGLTCLMKASLTLKVGYECHSTGINLKEPQEFIIEIKNNRINLLE